MAQVAQSPAPKAEEKKLQQSVPVKKGDYSIHIFLEEGRGFVPLKGCATLNPIVSFKVFNATKCSESREEVGTMALVKWSEHFFFEKQNCNVEDIENAAIEIELRDQRLLLSDSLIGSYSMDLTHVYFQKDHAIVHKWICLGNPSGEDFSTIKGYLKLGIAVLGEGDDQVDLAVAEIGELKDEDMMLPPQIQPQACQIVIRVVKGEHFPIMDIKGTIDAYVDCEFAGCHVRTKTITRKEKEDAVEWYEDLMIPAVRPTVTGKLKIRVWDYDALTPDELVGTVIINFEEIENEMKEDVPKRYGDYFWANVYGAPMEGSGGAFKDKMNAEPRIASYWRGRVLMKIYIVESDQPKMLAVPIKEQGLREMVNTKYDGTSEYETRCQIFGGSSLPLQGKQLRIVLKWCATEMPSTEKPNISGTCDWYETLKRKSITSPSDNIRDMPDIFLYLMEGSVIVSYIRLIPTDYQNLFCEPQWLQMIPDKSTARVTNDWEGGFLLIRFYCGLFESSRDTPTAAGWRESPVPPSRGKKLLCVNLFQCRNLPPADSNGKADPFVVVTCGAQKIQTDEKARMNNLNPMWYETLYLPVTCHSKQDAPPILIQVWDYDMIGSNDLMGMYVARAIEASEDPNIFQEPTWHKLTMGMSSGLGEILISFNLITASVRPTFSIAPAFEEVNVEVNVLGLRNLKPALGWVPVNKAYIVFDLSSLQMPGEGRNVRNIQTQPGEPGANPNLNVIIKFKCNIPLDPTYSPALSCSVFDYLFMGMSQPLLGSFSINLGEIYHKSRSRASGFNILGAALNKVRSTHSETPSTGTSLFPQTEVHVTSDFELKSQKLPVHEPSSGVQKCDSVKMTGEMSYNEAMLGGFVRMPQYKKVPNGRWRELDPPDENFFMQLGYDRVPGSERSEDHIMHYRYVLRTPMEDSQFIDATPFNHFSIIRGQAVGVDSYFDLLLPQSNLETVGQFKGLIRIEKASESEARRARSENIRKQRTMIMNKITSVTDFKTAWKLHSQEMDELAKADADAEFDDIAKKLLTQTRVLVRLYIIDGFGLAQKDTGSQSDPYVRIKLGSKEWYNEKENYQLDTPDPKINKMFELDTALPGVSLLKIQFWDYDDVFSDDKIGQTVIDLEDRFFSNKWKRLKEKPIETRPLFLKTTKVPQGGVRLWLEIVPIEAKPELTLRDITPRPPSEFEARVIVWGTDGVANYDDEGTSDLFVKAKINDGLTKETDTHYRCMTGKASFNFRMKFPVTLPCKQGLSLVLQIWDRDVFSKNDFIADMTLPLNETARLAWETGLRTKYKSHNNPKAEDRFWVTTMRRGEDGKMEEGGLVEISFELVPVAQASSCPVGDARNEPNMDPFLPPPVGRFNWSMNPCSLIQQTVGPQYIRKCVGICCLVLCLTLCIFMLPMLLSDFIANAAFSVVT